MKKKIALVGFGRWGKKIYNLIKNDFDIKYVLNSKDNISKIKSVSWVIVATPDKSHYKIVKYLLNKKFNVFCEKPLSTTYLKAKKLIEFSKIQKKKLVISEIERFKNLNLNIKKVNYIHRIHKTKSINKIENRIIYHNIYILFKHLNKKNCKLNFYKRFKNNKIVFELSCGGKSFVFRYLISDKKKEHLINNTNFLTTKDYINKMINKSFNYSHTQIKMNNIRALFCLNFIKKYLKK